MFQHAAGRADRLRFGNNCERFVDCCGVVHARVCVS
jgi:hypothetical protein